MFKKIAKNKYKKKNKFNTKKNNNFKQKYNNQKKKKNKKKINIKKKKNKILNNIKNNKKKINIKKKKNKILNNIKNNKKKIHNKKNKKIKSKNKNNISLIKKKNKKIKIYKRPPIISIMGHVNHGKTSLIDFIRSTNLTKTEKGNITQYINAYYINNKWGNITLLDTPGHSIFTNMRYRGINIADIILLIISIDDGIMPQTVEIIKYSQKYNIPIIIGLSKIDKKNYLDNINIIKKKINKYNIYPIEWGGKNIFVEFSIKINKGIKNIFKAIKEESNKINLITDINKPASGYIIESSINKNQGIITNIIIKNGKLKIGDIIISENNFGKIKLIYNDKNKNINYALPAMPVKILGLSKISLPGNKFISLENKKKIKKKIKRINNKTTLKIKKTSNKNIFLQKLNSKKKINFLLKTDVYGSLDTIKKSTKKILNDKINFIYSNIGEINENDLKLALASKSIILAFNIKINNTIKKKIKEYNIKVYFFNIIYKLIEKIKKIIAKKYKFSKTIAGKAKIKNIFNISKSDIIVGCIVIQGNINIKNSIKIIRNNLIIYKGKIKSLKRFKKNIKKVEKGTECGIYIKNFNKIKIGDIIESINIKNNINIYEK